MTGWLIIALFIALLVIRAQHRKVKELRRTIKDAAWSRRGLWPRRAKGR